MIAVSRDNGQMPLLYVNMAQATEENQRVTYHLSPANVIVSTDGGQTWKPAPTRGFPPAEPGVQQYAGPPLGVLSDGSVLFLVRAAQSVDTFYTWKLGETSWYRVGPSFNTVSTAFVVPGAGNTVCVVTRNTSGYQVHTFSI
jgi:hypothetical protein